MATAGPVNFSNVPSSSKLLPTTSKGTTKKGKGKQVDRPIIPGPSKRNDVDPKTLEHFREKNPDGTPKAFADVPINEDQEMLDADPGGDSEPSSPITKEEEEERAQQLSQQVAPESIPSDIIGFYSRPETCKAFQTLWSSADDEGAKRVIDHLKSSIQEWNRRNNRNENQDAGHPDTILGEFDTAKHLTQEYQTNPLARIGQGAGSTLCRDALEKQMTMIIAKFQEVLKIPIDKYLPREAAMIVEEHAEQRKDMVAAITNLVQAEKTRKAPEQSLSVVQAYANAGEIIPAFWDNPSRDGLRRLEAINKDLTSAKAKCIPTGKLSSAVTSVRQDPNRMYNEVFEWAKAMLEDDAGFPVQNWLPRSLSLPKPRSPDSGDDVEMSGVSEPPEIASDPEISVSVPDETSGPTVSGTDGQPEIVTGLQAEPSSQSSDLEVLVAIPDETDGLTIHGKVVHMIKFGSGYRVFVNYGTERQPKHGVLPGREFQKQAVNAWAKKDWPKPDWSSWRKNESVAGVQDVVNANGGHTYYLVAKGEPQRVGSEVELRPTGEQWFCTKTQMLKLVEKATLDRLDRQIRSKMVKRQEDLRHCQKMNLHPDTSLPLTEEEETTMPWLARDNYVDDIAALPLTTAATTPPPPAVTQAPAIPLAAAAAAPPSAPNNPPAAAPPPPAASSAPAQPALSADRLAEVAPSINLEAAYQLLAALHENNVKDLPSLEASGIA